MAGFQVSIYGRFWVSTEDAGRSFVVALPTIANTLHADILGISWAIIAYQLPRISLSVVFGRLGDIHGRYAIYDGGGRVLLRHGAERCVRAEADEARG